ncbi:MAG: hypothetical protein HQL53_11630 [Magnetococcales bacterium]|nr:hypothetical protein [Magnetococcales bacterium]
MSYLILFIVFSIIAFFLFQWGKEVIQHLKRKQHALKEEIAHLKMEQAEYETLNLQLKERYEREMTAFDGKLSLEMEQRTQSKARELAQQQKSQARELEKQQESQARELEKQQKSQARELEKIQQQKMRELETRVSDYETKERQRLVSVMDAEKEEAVDAFGQWVEQERGRLQEQFDIQYQEKVASLMSGLEAKVLEEIQIDALLLHTGQTGSVHAQRALESYLKDRVALICSDLWNQRESPRPDGNQDKGPR